MQETGRLYRPAGFNLVFVDLRMRNTLFKAQILPRDFLELKPEMLEFYFNDNAGVLGFDGRPHPNPRVSFFWQKCTNFFADCIPRTALEGHSQNRV